MGTHNRGLTMGKIFFYIVSIIIILFVLCAARPYYKRSRLNYDLEKAASYGTKHSAQETRRLVTKALKERGISYDPDNLQIEKDARDTVTISLNYEDSIHFFSIVIKKLEFELDVEQKNVKEYF